jgi:hypothetical protein
MQPAANITFIITIITMFLALRRVEQRLAGRMPNPKLRARVDALPPHLQQAQQQLAHRCREQRPEHRVV